MAKNPYRHIPELKEQAEIERLIRRNDEVREKLRIMQAKWKLLEENGKLYLEWSAGLLG